jgi:hypothetical protein
VGFQGGQSPIGLLNKRAYSMGYPIRTVRHGAVLEENRWSLRGEIEVLMLLMALVTFRSGRRFAETAVRVVDLEDQYLGTSKKTFASLKAFARTRCRSLS